MTESSTDKNSEDVKEGLIDKNQAGPSQRLQEPISPSEIPRI
jgi:hypothetical protein